MADTIDPRDLVPMDIFTAEPVAIDLVYANANHPENIFGTAVYEPRARLVLHKDLARIVLLTARLLNKHQGWILILKDGLRPVEAQQRLAETDTVKKNPHWLQEPRMLSGPGQGGHPRGMAVDVSVKNVDMGTVFDAMVPESARAFTGFDDVILGNRKKLETAFVEAAAKLGLPLLALPSEWWDFRIPMDCHKRFDPLSDDDLPPPLRMCSPAQSHVEWDAHFAALAKSIPLSL